MIITRILLMILTLGLFTNCHQNDSSNCFGLICTAEFKIITVSILDKNLDKVILDDFKVIDINSGTEVTPDESLYSLEYAQESGKYPIVTDGNIELDNTREMVFIGFINHEEVIRSNYIAEEKCCGVHLISGNLDLVIS